MISIPEMRSLLDSLAARLGRARGVGGTVIFMKASDRVLEAHVDVLRRLRAGDLVSRWNVSPVDGRATRGRLPGPARKA